MYPSKLKNISLVLCTLLAAVAVSFPRAAFADDDPLKSFPLQEQGFVVGAGAAVHALHLSSNPQLTGASSTPFAYVGVLPGTWFLAPETRKYCSSYHTRDQARHEAALVAAARTFPGETNLEQKIRNNVQEIKLHTGWNVNENGRCWSMRLGGFLALPGSFNANIRPSDEASAVTASKEIRPMVSFGLLVAPYVPYLHVLVGVTYSHVTIGPEGAALDHDLWSMFFGLGTTIDVIGGLFK
jgi:hypothetical protein